MKALRTILSAVLLGGFVVAQLPSLADCAMALGIQTVGCHMPCCKSMPMPASKCADLKLKAPQDVIASASLEFKKTVQQVATLAIPRISANLKQVIHRLTFHKDQLKLLLIPANVATRAPPKDIHLQFA